MTNKTLLIDIKIIIKINITFPKIVVKSEPSMLGIAYIRDHNITKTVINPIIILLFFSFSMFFINGISI